MSVQNEPEGCDTYDSAVWTSAQLDTFIKTNLGPTFSTNGISTLIFMPETGEYSSFSSFGSGCMTDSACYAYVGGINWHDYDATANSSDSISSATNPWPARGLKYWETEVSCGPGYGPSGCEAGFNTDMTTDGLMWAGLIDDRMVNENANAYLYWWLIGGNSTDDEALMALNGRIAQRAYVFGQYSKFVRPGYYRIDATHVPQTGVSISAYQNAPTNTLVIVATNYTGSGVSQTFNITSAPRFTSLTPYITSTSLSLAAQSAVSLSSTSFTYTLPADSVTTFVGSTTAPMAPPTGLKATVQ
jgi:glucuronoarabinoxylan endo-1,4-beta-xylanase